MRVFKLPDLGEGLPDAEIVEWHVAEGDHVTADQPMVSMETAKAVVEVPAPFTGTISKLHGAAGDVIDTGAPLVTFDAEDGSEDSDAVPGPLEEAPQEVTEQVAADALDEEDELAEDDAREDSGTVVGAMQTSNEVVSEATSQVGDYKVTPAVRAMARKLKVDLARVSPTGADGVITRADVEKAASEGTAPRERSAPAARVERAAPAPAPEPARRPSAGREPVRGTRRTMARAMSEAHSQVVPTTITEDADVALWEGKQDITVRMIRAMVAAVQREPSLNMSFYGDEREIHEAVHVGIAVDTPDGLFVSTLRDADSKTPAQLRDDLNTLRHNVENRSIPPKDLSGYTIMLSNVGVYAGKYTTPVVTPPCVAILATGKMRNQVVAAHGGIAVHPVIPLSLTFDHRAVTGGEAARFLAAYIEDLTRAS